MPQGVLSFFQQLKKTINPSKCLDYQERKFHECPKTIYSIANMMMAARVLKAGPVNLTQAQKGVEAYVMAILSLTMWC